jgi:hypothetical protein
MFKAKLIVLCWKISVIFSAIITINWLIMMTPHWLLVLLLYISTGLVVRSAYGRMIPTQPDGAPIESSRSNQEYIAVNVIEFCNQYAFPILWPIILLLVTLNPFRAEE